MAKTKSVSRAVAPTRLSMFGPPPLLEGESAADYDELLARVSGAVKPEDILEEIWVRDVIDLAWETFRLRRLKVNLLAANAHKGLKDVLETQVDWNRAAELARGWSRRDRDVIKEVDKLLASAGLTMDAVMAQTMSLKMDDIERIDRMLMGAEARRNAILREIDRHRASVAQMLRKATDEVVTAQFERVEAKQITDRSAA
jgi:hypothetical protein